MMGAYNRDVSYRKAKRKQRISNKYWGDYYDNLHQYSKNKIHCSCACCSPKTRNKGHRRYRPHANYAPAINYKHSDMVKVLGMEERYSIYYQVRTPNIPYRGY